MGIISGFKKMKNYIFTGEGFQLISRWTHASTVEFEDGKTAQEKLGDISGITTDLNTKVKGYAADMTTVASVNTAVQQAVNKFDNYYTAAQVNSKLQGKSDTSHNHDTVYYTKGEVNSALASRDTQIGQRALASQVYSTANTYSKTEVNSLLKGYVGNEDTGHFDGRYYTKDQIGKMFSYDTSTGTLTIKIG